MSKNSFSKKEQFTQPSKSKMPLFAAVFGVVLVAIIVFIAFRPNKIEEVGYFGDIVASPRSYIGEVISMTSVEPVIENNLIKIPLSQVSDNNIVSFEIANSEGELVPLMAYITPTGRLFAGSSMCEPCRGRTFSLAGETLLCDTCRTTYDIENHEFISGAYACGSYPPVNMNPRVEGDMIIIELEEVLNWRLRI